MGQSQTSDRRRSDHDHDHHQSLEAQAPPQVVKLLQRRFSGTTSQSVDREAFQIYFSNPVEGFGQRLYTHVNRQNHPGDPASGATTETDGVLVTKRDFLNTAKELLSLSNSKSGQIKFYCSVYSGGGDKLSEAESRQLVEAAFVMYMASCGYRCEVTEDSHADILAKFATKLSTCRDMNAISHCIQSNCPELLTGMHSWVLSLLNGEANPDTLQEILDSRLIGSMLSYPLAWLISCCVPATYTVESTLKSSMDSSSQHFQWDHWVTLYDSNSKGLSMNRFQHHIFSYKGPTIMVVTCSAGYLFIVAVDQEWRESLKHWGGAGCSIFQLSPTFKLIEEGPDMMFLNDKSRSLPRGITIGRNSKSLALSIDGGLSTVKHTYGMQNDLVALEVLACGSSSALSSQAKQKQWELREAHKQRRVPLPGKWEENPDKFILEMGGIKVNHAEQIPD
ncbi:uncharacterized protein LOC144449634 [Glandiceps talaboti]